MTHEWKPDWTVHPGETLAETLEQLGMSQREFARRTELTPKHVNRIIRGHSGYTADVAVRFERVTGIPARFWLALLAQHRTFLARNRAAPEP